jgi:hypothetical protein
MVVLLELILETSAIITEDNKGEVKYNYCV